MNRCLTTRRRLRLSARGFLLTPLLACSLLTACVKPQMPRIVTGEKITREQLTSELQDFGSFFEVTIKQASSDLDELLGDKDTKRATLRWRLRMIPVCRMVLKQDDPRRAFLDAWGLSTRMRLYLTAGEGKALFGAQQSIATTAARRIEDEIERVGHMFLEEAQLMAADKHVDEFASRYPIHGVFSGIPVRMASQNTDKFSTFAAIVSSPLQVLSGVDRTAEAVRGFTLVADRFADITATLPEATRWQIEALLLDLEDNAAFKTIVARLEEIAGLRETLEKLPIAIREEGERLIDHIDQRQTALQETLDRAEKTTVGIERALDRVDVVAKALDETAKSTADAGRAWDGAARTIGETVKSFSGNRDAESVGGATSGPAEAPGRAGEGAAEAAASEAKPGIEEYRRTIEEANRTAGELRQLASEVREMVDSQALADRIKDVDRTMSATVDRAVRGLAILIVLAFVLAVVYRIVATRMTRRGG